MNVRKLSADDVCAFCWDQLCEQTRGAVCVLARLPQTLSLLEWYELNSDQRSALRLEIADLIEHNASRQRVEYAPERAA